MSAAFATDMLKADEQRDAWMAFVEQAKSGGDATNGPTVKERNRWLSDHQALGAELVTVGGSEFKPRTLDEAVAVIESLGFVTNEVDQQPWEAHADKGLKQVTLRGQLDPSRAPRFAIKSVQTRATTTRPNPPFTTASLQQAASSELGFAPSRTMRVAQQLYEGVDLGGGEGPVGLITYMRTDSTNLSKDSINAARDLIQSDFGPQHLPVKPNRFGKAKRAQEAHEAVRPSDASRRPDSVRGSLTSEQHRLYDLIWRRFVACQMTPAKWDSTTVLIGADVPPGEAVFKATGRRLVFDGFLRVMGRTNGDDVQFPALETDQEVAPLQVDPQQQYTSPPPRYSEAALVKKLEAEGIGRPSTYAAIIQTIQDRGYIDLIDKRLRPTERGKIVTEKLVGHFPQIMDVKFTSHMEEELDKIEEAHLDWAHVLGEFYEPFKESLDRAEVEMERPRAEPSEYSCPECGKQMVYRLGKNGRFLACSGYPDCKVSMNIDDHGKPTEAVVAEEPCALCGKQMILRKSRLGPFLGCTGYPECTNTLPCDEVGAPLKKVEPEDIKESCGDCGSAMVVKFARGRSFMGCSAYPKCKATQPLPPGVYVEKPKPEDAGARCDKCGRPIVIRKGRRGPFLSCSGFPRCRNALPMEKLAHLKELEAAGQIPDAPPETNGNGRNGAKGGRGRNGQRDDLPRDAKGKVDIAALGPPPEGFAWTRTGRPVVETWPEEPLTCPDCGGDVMLKSGRFGPYFGCSSYPKCSFVSNLRGEAKKRADVEMPRLAKPKPVPTKVACDECGEHMVIRTGRSGPFLGCSKYPKCRFSQPLPEGETAETLATAGK